MKCFSLILLQTCAVLVLAGPYRDPTTKMCNDIRELRTILSGNPEIGAIEFMKEQKFKIQDRPGSYITIGPLSEEELLSSDLCKPIKEHCTKNPPKCKTTKSALPEDNHGLLANQVASKIDTMMSAVFFNGEEGCVIKHSEVEALYNRVKFICGDKLE